MATATITWKAQIADLTTKLTQAGDISVAQAERMTSAVARAIATQENGVARQAQIAARATADVERIMQRASEATMSAAEKAAAAVQREVAALERLKAAGADVARVEAARAAVASAGAKQIGALKAQEVAANAAANGAAKVASAGEKQVGVLKAQEVAATGAAEGMSKMARAGHSVAQQMPDVITQLASGTSVMQVLTQQGLQIVQVHMQDLIGVAGRFGVSLGGLAQAGAAALPAVAALGLAYMVLGQQLEHAEARAASFARGAEKLGVAHKKLDETAAAIDQELSVLVGTYDELGAAQERRDKAVRAEATAQRAAADALVEEAQLRHAQSEGQEQVAATLEQLNRARRQAAAITDDANQKEAEALQKSAQITEYKRTQAETEAWLAEQERRRAAGKQKRSEDEARLAKLEAERLAALRQLYGIQQSASLAALDGEERLTEALKRQLEVVNQLETTSQDSAAASAARQALAAQYAHDIAEIRAREAKRAANAEKKSIEDVERARKAAMQQAAQTMQQVGSLLTDAWGGAYDMMAGRVAELQRFESEMGDQLTGSQRKQLDRRIKDQKRAANNAFDVSQTAASATAAVNTAVAVTAALTSAPFPLSLVSAAGAAAAGVAQQRAIARSRPSFHTGGGVDLAPDEVSAKLKRREFVLTETGRRAMGDDRLHAANAGAGGGGGEVVAVSVYKHSAVVDRWKKDGLRAGDPIARAIRRGRLVGLRQR